MKKIIITVLLWALVIGWMGSIFYMSHQTRQESGDISKDIAGKVYENIDLTPERFEHMSDEWLLAHYNIFVRKFAHVFQYLILGILLILAISRHFNIKSRIFLLSLGIGIVYAISDELHQTLVPGRSGMIADVLLDSVGVFIGCSIIMITVWIYGKVKKRRDI